jgi:DMSO/TMAO reductase YedYZ molybdopterin-dependent catalytic subunit
MHDPTEWTKPCLVMHEDPAYNAEPPVGHLDPPLTPADCVFVRNNGALDCVDLAPERWRLAVDGEVERPLSLGLEELIEDFPRAEVAAGSEIMLAGVRLLSALRSPAA